MFQERYAKLMDTMIKVYEIATLQSDEETTAEIALEEIKRKVLDFFDD